MIELFLDLETYSECDLKKHGVYRYADHATTEILLFGYAIDDGPAKVWDRTKDKKMPADLKQAILNGAVVKIAQNSNFDRNILKAKKCDVPIEQWEDTMVIAYTLSIPGNLEQMLIALGAELDFQKEKDGKRLVGLFCMPQKITKNQQHKRRDRHTDPQDWANFVEYCRQDVESMRWAYRNMPQWVIGRNGREQARRELALWHLSEKINDRGMPIDLALARAAIELTTEEIGSLNAELRELTGGQVDAHSKRDAMLAWVRSYGVNIKGYTKEDLTDLLKTELPDKVRRALEIRQEAGRTSTTKYQALIDAACDDGYLRGGIQYYGAMRTGRYAGRRFQPQNLPHPEIDDTDQGAEDIIDGVADIYHDSVMAVAVSCVRSAIKAPDGKSLIVSDLSNIEGRKLAWLADERWKLKAFRDFDAGHGHDLYKLAYATSFGVDPDEVTKDNRQIGKVQELALGYQGGVGAFYSMAKKFNLDLEDVHDQVIHLASNQQLESADWMIGYIRDNRTDLDELSDKAIVGADLVKQSWREANPAIVKYWYSLQDMVNQAIRSPGAAFQAGRIKAVVRDENLLILLPSKRPLVYRKPWITRDGTMFYKRFDKGRWVNSVLYGGLLAENVCQASARDVLTYNMPEVDVQLPIIGTVHDEIISLHESHYDDDMQLAWMDGKLATNPPWADGLPLAAAGYVAQRYRKD